jgi:hypothetical protein
MIKTFLLSLKSGLNLSVLICCWRRLPRILAVELAEEFTSRLAERLAALSPAARRKRIQSVSITFSNTDIHFNCVDEALEACAHFSACTASRLLVDNYWSCRYC